MATYPFLLKVARPTLTNRPGFGLATKIESSIPATCSSPPTCSLGAVILEKYLQTNIPMTITTIMPIISPFDDFFSSIFLLFNNYLIKPKPTFNVKFIIHRQFRHLTKGRGVGGECPDLN